MKIYFKIIFIILILFNLIACEKEEEFDIISAKELNVFHDVFRHPIHNKKSSYEKGNLYGSFFVLLGSIDGSYEKKETEKTWITFQWMAQEGLVNTTLPYNMIVFQLDENIKNPQVKFHFIKRKINIYGNEKELKEKKEKLLSISSNSFLPFNYLQGEECGCSRCNQIKKLIYSFQYATVKINKKDFDNLTDYKNDTWFKKEK